jgi:hypothetical protein
MAVGGAVGVVGLATRAPEMDMELRFEVEKGVEPLL